MKFLHSCKKEFIFGSLIYSYNLIKQERKTLSLIVKPDLQIFLKCPHNIDDERLELFLKRKWYWLEKQLTFFGKYHQKEYKREYVSGESYRYLGRQYKLVIEPSVEDKVSLLRGVLLIMSARTVMDKDYTKKLIAKWYEEKARHIFNERLEEMKRRFNYSNEFRLVLRDMRRRWGSFVNKDKIALNPKLIHLSKDCIDYVIVHELCHGRYKNHDKKFFDLLNEKYPKWEKVKEKLEVTGAFMR